MQKNKKIAAYPNQNAATKPSHTEFFNRIV